MTRAPFTTAAEASLLAPKMGTSAPVALQSALICVSVTQFVCASSWTFVSRICAPLTLVVAHLLVYGEQDFGAKRRAWLR